MLPLKQYQHMSTSNKLQSSKHKKQPWNYFQISVTPSHALLHVRSGVHLYSYDQIPPHQHENPYITHGYRSYLSAKQCLKSVLILSNELVNIWSHGGMGFLLLCLLFYDHAVVLPSLKTSISDHFIFLTFSLCTQACMMCSMGYHTFNCHVHEKVATRWYATDLYGITVGMLGCYSIGLYYGFYCVQSVRIFYTVIILLMIIASGCLMLHPNYFTKRWHYYRITHLTTVSVFGFLPTLHWTCITPLNEVKEFLPDVFIFYGVLGIAMLFYLSKLPERIWPGRFNYAGHSHNWWHVLINVAILHWRSFALRILQHRLATTCPIASSDS